MTQKPGQAMPIVGHAGPMRLLCCLLAMTALEPVAHADVANYLVGPVLGIRLGGPPGDRLIVGVEGGVGVGPERINLGFTNRLDKMFYYVEIDPWYIVGATLGVGIDSDGKASGVVGVWEGLPLVFPNCEGSGYFRAVTISGGYRYTGVHELYLTPKAGVSEDICLD